MRSKDTILSHPPHETETKKKITTLRNLTTTKNLKITLGWKTVKRFLKKLKMEQPYDAASPLLGMYSYAEELPAAHVHSSVIYNSQAMNTTEVAMNR